MLKPGAGKTHRAYLWAYTPTTYDSLRAVIYDFTSSRADLLPNLVRNQIRVCG